MIVLSHRGFWHVPAEKNSVSAFADSFSHGWGIETDLRDRGQSLIVSHDPPAGHVPSFAELLAMPRPKGLPFALNVKADGIARSIAKGLDASDAADDAFVFDMSVPEMRSYFAAGIPVFARMSEVEREPPWLDRAAGVWLDGFEGTWYDQDTISRLLDAGKRVCVVSPELHDRAYYATWELLRKVENPGLMLCTDRPDAAEDYFS